MTEPERGVQINISGIPVAGVGGLGLVAMAVLVSVVMPAAWWLMVSGVLGGCVLGAGLVLVRRRLDRREPGDASPSVLFVDTDRRPTPSEASTESSARQREKRVTLVPARQRA